MALCRCLNAGLLVVAALMLIVNYMWTYDFDLDN